ncbi:MAG: dUTP diphosphatase [Ahrensia sp.]|nr:dUTP diphosphatase [Ahrensia sp.]
MSALKVQRLLHAEGLPLPSYETLGAAGMDLRAAVDETLTLEVGQRALVPTGLAIQLPMSHEGQVRPRSGLAVKHGITVLNAPGTIDEDYRGEIHIPLINLGDAPFMIERGMRIAQLVIAPVRQLAVEEVLELETSARGSGGFGSTGV